MAATKAVSPSTEGTACILKSTETEASPSLQQNSKDTSFLQPGFTSAPELLVAEENGKTDKQPPAKSLNRKKRRRRNSVSETSGTGALTSHNAKRRKGSGGHHKRHTSNRGIILPTKFLLGGNITDPLNLNSMMDENINRALNAVTPASSPLPPRNSVIDIITPVDVTDPLGLNSSNLTPPLAASKNSRTRSKRNRRRKSQLLKNQDQNSVQTSIEDDRNVDEGNGASDVGTVTTKVDSQKRNLSPVKRLTIPVAASQANVRDPIVSPAIPQNTRRSKAHTNSKHRRRRQAGKHGTSDAGMQTESTEVDDKLRCGSEKIIHREYFSPVKRRRTCSENLSERDCEGDFFSSFVNDTVAHPSRTATERDLENVLEKPIGTINPGNLTLGTSPAQNYMNSEKTSPKKSLTVASKNKSDAAAKLAAPVKAAVSDVSQCDTTSQSTSTNKTSGKKKPYNARFQYGNYTQYYGYRNQEKFKDVRMECLKKEWFKDKDVLDVGCNAGHLTLLIAKEFQPRKVVGVDIDDKLIRIARNNVRHYASNAKPGKCASKFPASMAITMGPLATPPVETGKDDTTAAFPNNVNFFQGNYVPKKDEFLRFQEPEYDIILCMSVSKWIHMNWGDEGLLRLFRRAFKQLRAGGMFIFEPQPWSSYSSKRKMCEQLNENYQKLKIRPDDLPAILTKEIGFDRVEHLKMPEKNNCKGFRRPIQAYYKPE